MLERKTTVLVVSPTSRIRRKRRGKARIDTTRLHVGVGRRGTTFVDLGRGDVVAAELVDQLRGLGSIFSPLRGVVLRVECGPRASNAVVGIVLPTAEADPWLTAARELMTT